MAGGPGPEEGHRVGGVQVPHHGPGGAGEAGHEVLILRIGEVIAGSQETQ